MGRSRTQAFALTPMGGGVPEDQEVFPTLQTEVWSWGHGEHGELGHGDNLDRWDRPNGQTFEEPKCYFSLSFH